MTIHHSPLTTHHSRRHGRRAFTLVEMLIAMVLTLILVTAIAEFYAIIGDSVKDGRAMIELGGRLRAAVERLTADLDLITVSVVPWTDDGSSSGYFEYFEGRGNDWDADADGNVDATLDVNSNSINDLIENGLTNLLGDADDFLAFTIRSSGQPFSGRYFAPSGQFPAGSRPIITSTTTTLAASTTVPTIVNAQLAEVVWWVGFDDLDSNQMWTVNSGNAANTTGLGEPRHLYRRQLLIRPELGQLASSSGPYSFDTTGWKFAQQDLMRFWQFNDISASIRAELGSGGWAYVIRANSLNDLTRRENRFGHMPLQVTAPKGFLADALFPHSAVTQSTVPSGAQNAPNLLPCYSAASPNVQALAGATNAGTTSFALQRITNPSIDGESPGEDIVLSNVLGFDVKAYDPYARIWPDTAGTSSLLPHDPGYSAAAVANGTPQTLVALGAFVDLNYYRYLTSAAITKDTNLVTTMGISLPYFGYGLSNGLGYGIPPYFTTAAQQLTYRQNIGDYNGTSTPYMYMYGVTYDTWALSYERDGIDQSNNGSYDLQTNGIDDDGANGVDDVNERDTLPPYSYALRGLQVKIRVYEPSTRQVRQASVAADFITE